MPASATTALCPLCRQPNACAVAAGAPAEGCWCMREPVSRVALAHIPADARGRACICPRCAQATIISGHNHHPPQDSPCPPTTSK